ncbi:MAG: nitrate ABC transporter ATP-binding protein [Deltaproteobacteria bacterium]|nr:MAG: nitrate ABC transporter ATP-binding protein [Deltaproteobacteria bacterium]
MRVIIENLSKFFTQNGSGSIEVLRDINFTIEQGEFVCVVGPSGCGKTTLLNIIAGLVAPTSGKVSFEGTFDNARSLTAVVFQELALFPWRTVEANVEFGLEEKRINKAQRKKIVQEFISLVGLSGFEKNYPHQISGGMKQRAAIARALAMDPMLLLMDEPFSALDAETRAMMQWELANIFEKTKKTVMYITHYIPEAVFLGDRVVVLGKTPAQVEKIINIDLPRPRKEEIKLSPEFMEYLKEIWGLMRSGTSSINLAL